MSLKHALALSFLPVIIFATRAYSQEPPPVEEIGGAYYFKGIGILEIRTEGENVVVEMPGERGIWSFFFTPPRPNASEKEEADWPKRQVLIQKLEQYRHRGRRTGPRSVDFGSFDVTLENLLKHFGVTEADLPPEEKSALQALLGGKNLGNYFERWNLLPGGRLEIDAAVPLFSYPLLFAPSAGEENPKIQTFFAALNAALATPAQSHRDVLAEFRLANPHLCKRVCGWKINHLGEVEGWKTLEAQQYAEAAGIFQKAAAALPASPFPCFGEVWARIGTREFQPAWLALQTAQKRLTPETSPFLEELVFLLADQIYSYETLAAGPNADYVALAETFESRWPPETRRQDMIAKFSGKKARAIKPNEYDEIKAAVAVFPLWQDLQKVATMRGRSPLLPPGPKALSIEARLTVKIPNMLSSRNIASMVVFSGHLWRAQADFRNAIFQYTVAVRLGQIARRGPLIGHLIGVTMEELGLNALLDLFEDGFIKDGDTLKYMTEMVEFLDKNEPRPSPGELLAFGATAAPVMSDPIIEFALLRLKFPDFSDALALQKVHRARFAVLQAVCVLKKQCLVPPFPEKMDPATLPADPFTPNEKIRYVYRQGDDSATLYSIGPDLRDQGTTLRYDPTNGNASGGDIYLRTR